MRYSEWAESRRTIARHERSLMYVALPLSLLANLAFLFLIASMFPSDWLRHTPVAYIIRMVAPSETVQPALPPQSAARPRREAQPTPPVEPATAPPAPVAPSSAAPAEHGVELVGPVAPAPSNTTAETPPLRPGAISTLPPSVPGIKRLFDTNVIERVARADIEADIARRSSGVTFDTKELMYMSYMRMLKEKIEGIWEYPSQAARKGISGSLLIEFEIMKDGRLGRVEVVRTSGYPMLDEAAKRALYSGQPYWPLPDTWHRESITIPGRFIYYLGDRYVE